jgi:uncharacterized protein (TIGR02217 family)
VSFWETELTRAIEFQQDGGRAFNTDVQAVQSGQEQRNSIWLLPAKGEYTASNIAAEEATGTSIAFLEDVRCFFYLVGGQRDGFRYWDPIDNSAGSFAGKSPEALAVIPGTSNLQWQLGKNYSRGGRSLFVPVYKPITASVIDYLGNNLTNSVTIHSGVSPTTIDHTSGIVTFPTDPGVPTADFKYHIPVHFTIDKFNPTVEKSNKGNRITRWHFGLMIVGPPNY